jgi:hypothetical protein
MKKLKDIMHKLLAILSFLVLSACNSSKDDSVSGTTPYTLGKSKYYTVSSGDLTNDGDSVSGTGSIIFEAPIDSIKTGIHVELDGTIGDSGSITLIAFSDRSLENGIELKFSRDDDKLDAVVIANGKTENLSDAFADQSVSEVGLSFDIHNDEAPAHVLVWPASSPGFGEDDTIYNSEDGPQTPGNGNGPYWGMHMSKATVTKAEISEPRFEE